MVDNEIRIDNVEKCMEHVLKTNRPEYNISKLLEELIELSEVLIKGMNKKPENQPPIEKYVEEIGDVAFRIAVVIKQLDIADKVEQRLNIKAVQLLKYVHDDKYKGGL